MKLGPRPTGRQWTPADDAQLLALLASGLDRAVDRSEAKTVRACHSQPKEPPESRPVCRAGAEGEGEIAAEELFR